MHREKTRKRPTVEQISVGGLDACDLLRAGAFPRRGANIVRWPMRWFGVSQLRVERSRVRVNFVGNKPAQIIRVSWTACNFGGQRPWLHCLCGRRVRMLLPEAGEFSCRRCFGNPLYASQSTSVGGRKHLAAAKLRLRLGGDASPLAAMPDRPKGMHEATFRRLTARLKGLEAGLSRRVKARTPDYPSLVAGFDN